MSNLSFWLTKIIYVPKKDIIQIIMSSNNNSNNDNEIQDFFEELNIETFEKRNKFLKYEQKTDIDNQQQYLTVTTVTSSIN